MLSASAPVQIHHYRQGDEDYQRLLSRVHVVDPDHNLVSHMPENHPEPPGPTGASRRVRLRPVDRADLERLAAILAEDGVKRWWGEHTLESVEQEFLGGARRSMIIEVDGEVAGAVQVTEETDPDYRHAAVDLFLSDRWQGRGYGPEALKLLASHLIHSREHHRITIDPAVRNLHAIRAYEKVGFRPVGVMRQYERGPDGKWRDGLLMDLLAEDLRTD